MKALRNLKAMNERNHTRKRCLQRYGIYLNHSRYRQAVGDILQGRSELLHIPSRRLEIHRVLVDQVPVIFVYDNIRKEMVTALQRDWVVGKEYETGA